MKCYNIAIIKGDGIGFEIVNEAIKVLNAVCLNENFKLSYKEYLMGGCAYDITNNPLPNETVEGCKKSDAILFGAIGGEKWDSLERHLRPESGLLRLRKELGVYANLRPINVFDELLDVSTIKPEVLRGVDLLIVRELTGGIYFGQPRNKNTKKALNTMVYTKEEIKRVAIVAFDSAMRRRKKVCSIDKANVLEVSQLWRETVEEVAKNYSEVSLSHMYVDNAAMQLVYDPKQFDVMLTSNMFGDILSDEASMICGSIGLLPSASIGGKVGLFEPIHGSAPNIAGLGIANPIATIMSAAMMLRFSLGEESAALRVEKAIQKVLKDGYRTKDLANYGAKKICSTSEMGSIIAKNVAKI
ncbi:MAG: 3-isopropylmalate dehydrogenase [Sulfurospirillum sp.]|nr:3-isopropylmalate dehydrogenase [Sulfurospirillum sp.]